jgi:hypothetical protein
MSVVIAFLESLGRAPAFSPDAGRLRAIGQLTPDVHAALGGHDPASLVRLLGGRPFMACSILTPESDEPLPDGLPASPDEVPEQDEVRVA